MKLITLTQGKFTQVDDEDFDFLNQFKWQAKRHKNSFYAARTINTVFGRKEIKLHRVVLCLIDSSVFSDHIDHDGLNNQKINLRECTKSENNRNKTKKKNKSSSYLGVHKYIYVNKKGVIKYRFRSMIRVSGILIQLGSFGDEIEAARAYDMAAKKHFGEFSNLNFKI